MIAQLFLKPMELGRDHLWLVLPLCALLAIIYKTVRVGHVRDLPKAVLGLWTYMLLGLTALALGLAMLLRLV